jgi:hypothetical protein
VDGGQEFVAVAQVVLAELGGGVALALSTSARVGSSFWIPRVEPGMPMVVMPVRTGIWPVMKAARPAVQLGWP